MRAITLILILAVGTGIAWAGNRPDINSFTLAQRNQLKNLMDGYIDKVTAGEHCNTHGIHGSLIFFPWHRGYIARMEDYLATHGGAQFVPLPKYDPSTTIPAPFDTFVDADCSNYTCMFGDGSCAGPFDTTPNRTIPSQFAAGLCGNTDFSVFSPAFESQFHNGVHGAIGGVLKNYRGPSAPLFWLWHAYVDDVWYQWECACGLSEGTLVEDEKNLHTGSDLWMKDSDEDVGNEPNGETGSNLWSSGDIWVRNVRDTQQTSVPDPARFSNEHAHQNPEYSANPSNTPWIYVKTRNRGCSPVSGNLHVYWANASTGLDWDSQWNEITGSPIHISALPSAEIGVAEIQWTNIPAPTPTAGSHFCLLARFEGDAGTDPIAGEIQTPDIGINVRNSNNIAWKNVTVVDDVANKTGGVIVRSNGQQGLARLDIRMPEAAAGGNYLDIGTLRAALPPSLFGIWNAGGRRGTGFTVDPNTNELIIQSTSASIQGLALQAGTDHLVSMKFDQTVGACESGSTEFKVEMSELFDGAAPLRMPAPSAGAAGGMTYDFRTDTFLRSSPGVDTSYPRLVECSAGSIPISAAVPSLPVGLTVTSYAWFLDGSPVPGATQSSVMATQSGAWTVRVGYSNGCFSTSPPHPFFVGNPPPNDGACAASPLVLGTPVVFSNHCATAQAGEVSPGIGSDSSGCNAGDGWCREDPNVQNSIWYTFVAPTSGSVTLEADHADVQFAVWNVSNCASFTGGFAKVAANDDGLVKGPWGTSPALSISGLIPGRTYYLQVDGFLGVKADSEITLSAGSSSSIANIPVMSGWGLALLAGALILAGSLLMLRRSEGGG